MSRRLGRYQAVADRTAHQPRHIEDAEPLHDLAAVGLHRLDAQEQALGDLPGAVAFGDELQDLTLTRRQQLELGFAPPARRSACSTISGSIARHR